MDSGHDARVDVRGGRRLTGPAAERSSAVHKGGAHAGPFSRGVPHSCRVVEREPEIHHPEQHEHDDRDHHREFDQALAALASSLARQSDHRTGSIRTVFERENVSELLPPELTNVPSGVLKRCVYVIRTVMKSGPPVCVIPAVAGHAAPVGTR